MVGNEDGFNLRDSNSNFNMANNGGPYQAQPAGHTELPFHQPGNPRPPLMIRNRPYNHPMPHQTNHSNPASSSNYPANYSNPHVGRPSYPPTRTPGYHPPPPYAPPPPPPHTSYVTNFLPRTNDPSKSYVNMPGAGRGVGPGFGVGLGAGALAAGAVIFGDDIMSGYDIPTAGIRDASLAFATDPF